MDVTKRACIVPTILLADDNEVIRRVIRFLLSQRADLEISAEAVDGEQAVQMARARCPDLAILDISMPRNNGIEAAKEIVAICPQTIVLYRQPL
jgi:DNA-binding NarL/FixJ family response regulator